MKKTYKYLGFLSLAFFIQSMVLAEINILVLDQFDQPIDDVVIAYNSEDTISKDNIEVMDQVSKRFVPRILNISQGQKVSFPNSDNIRHHVYSFSKTKPFEIKLYKQAPSEPLLFPDSGIVVLGCNIHDRMIGYIYVSDDNVHTKTLIDGKATIANPIGQKITLWHPRLSKNSMERKTIELKPLDSNDQLIIRLELLPKLVDRKKSFRSRFKK